MHNYESSLSERPANQPTESPGSLMVICRYSDLMANIYYIYINSCFVHLLNAGCYIVEQNAFVISLVDGMLVLLFGWAFKIYTQEHTKKVTKTVRITTIKEKCEWTQRKNETKNCWMPKRKIFLRVHFGRLKMSCFAHLCIEWIWHANREWERDRANWIGMRALIRTTFSLWIWFVPCLWERAQPNGKMMAQVMFSVRRFQFGLVWLMLWPICRFSLNFDLSYSLI